MKQVRARIDTIIAWLADRASALVSRPLHYPTVVTALIRKNARWFIHGMFTHVSPVVNDFLAHLLKYLSALSSLSNRKAN